MKKNVEKTMWHIPECYKDVLLKDEKLLEYYYKQTEERFAYEMELSERTKSRLYNIIGVVIALTSLLITLYLDSKGSNWFLLCCIIYYVVYLIAGIIFVLPDKTASRFYRVEDCLKDIYYKEINKMGDVNYSHTIFYYLPSFVDRLNNLIIYNKKRVKRFRIFLLISLFSLIPPINAIVIAIIKMFQYFQLDNLN